MSEIPTLRFATVAGEQFVEVAKLVRLLRAMGETRAADLLEASACDEDLLSWRVKP